jgi:hypothetical protein
MAKDSMSDVITIGIIAGIGIGLYEWLKNSCASGGNMAGSQICSGYNSLFGPATTPVTAAAPAPSTSAPPAITTPSQPASQPVVQTSPTPAAPVSSPSSTAPPPSSTQTDSPATCLLPPGYFAIATDMGMDTNGNVIYAPGCVAPGSSQSASSQPSVTAAELLAQAVASPVPESGGSFGGSNPNNNVDIWSYYYQQQTGTAISPGTLQAAFPYLTSSNRGSMTASAFLNAIQGQGMSGLGTSPNLIPASLIHRRSRGPVGIPMVLWRARV